MAKIGSIKDRDMIFLSKSISTRAKDFRIFINIPLNLPIRVDTFRHQNNIYTIIAPILVFSGQNGTCLCVCLYYYYQPWHIMILGFS